MRQNASLFIQDHIIIRIDAVPPAFHAYEWRAGMSTQSIEVVGPSVLAVPRPAYLMCPPRYYDVNYVINPWMAGNLHASSRTQATEQWRRLYHALIQIADVELIVPQPGSPDMVFTANGGLQHAGTVVLSRFLYPER